MNETAEGARDRLAALSSSARRLLDYVAVLEGGARYEALRRAFRLPEQDLIDDLHELAEAGMLRALPGQPNSYEYVDPTLRELVLAEAGEERLPKLRARAERAQRRTTDG